MSQYSLIEDTHLLSEQDRFPTSTSGSILEKKTDFNILEKLKSLRDNRKYCDVILEVRGVKFVAHKNVLAAWSPVLGAKLYGDDPKVYKDHILVHYDNSEVFSDLLDFMYNGYVAPRETNFLQLLHLAVSFQIETLKNYCEEFLRCNLHLGNFVSTFFLSRKFKLDSLEEYIVGFLQLNLSDAVKQGEFLSLSAEKFNTFLLEGWMKKMKPEIKLFLIISWVGYDVQEREKYLVVLLGHIDWSTVANDFLLEINRTENFFTTHESSLYLLLQTLYSAGIPLGPYRDVFPQLRASHSAILKEVVHTNLLKMDTEQFHPVTFHVKSRPFPKDSSVNTIRTLLPCNLKDTAVNTDVNSLHFQETEEQPIAENGTLTEQPVVKENTKYEQFETLGEFIEAEIHEINEKQKEKERLSREQNGIVEAVSDMKKEISPRKPSTRNSSRKKNMENKRSPRETDQSKSPKSRSVTAPEKFAVAGSSENTRDRHLPENARSTSENNDPDWQLAQDNVEKPRKGHEFEPSEESEDSESEKETKIQTRVKKTQTAKGSKQPKVPVTDPNAKMLNCKYKDCAYMTKFPQRLEKHIRCVHEASFDLRCNLCQFDTKEVRKYNKHMKQHFSGPPYNCDYPRCTYSAEKIQPMLTHRAIHSDDRPFACHCGMRFRTNNTLIAHKKVHLGKKEFTCTVCGVSFATRNTLSQHSVKHSDVRPYLCDLCGFSTKFQSHLIAHKRLHSGDVFKCQFPNCSYFSPKRSQLKSHMRAHLGIRAHVCGSCGKSFIERSHLLRHEKLHTDNRLQCDRCEYTTPRKDKLKEHIKRHHTEPSDDDVSQKPTKKARMINTKRQKKSKVKAEVGAPKQEENYELGTPLVVNWDHGGYSLTQVPPEAVVHTENTPLLGTDGEYCVLRETLTTSEPVQQILTIDQINASMSVAKALGPVGMVGQVVSSSLEDMESRLSTRSATALSTLSLVSIPAHVDTIATSTVGPSKTEISNAQTFTVIQATQDNVSQQEYGGLSAFMTTF